MVKNCLNPRDPEVSKLHKAFGEVTTALIVDKYYPDGNFTYNDVITNKQVLQDYGIISNKEIREDLGVGFPKQISSKQLINLKKAISDKNNKQKDFTYKLFNVNRVGQADLYEWGVQKFKGAVNIEAKLERAISQNTGTVASENKITDLQKQLQELNKPKEGDQLKLFNLNAPDISRKQLNRELNTLLKDIITKLSVVTPKGTKEIKFERIEEYKNAYESRNGKSIDNIGVADIIDATIAYTEEDGITLPEECIHFILFVIKDSPEVQDLINSTDANGISLVKKSKIYRDNYRQYLEIYNGDVARTELELLGKLIAQYMYDNRRATSTKNKIAIAIENFINSIIRIFKKKVKLAYELDGQYYPVELRKKLGIIDAKITSQEYFNDAAKNKINATSPLILNLKVESPSTNLRKVVDSVKQLIQQKKNILNTLDNKGKDWSKYKYLFNTTGIATSPEDSVTDLTVERIQEALDNVELLIQANPHATDLIDKRTNLRELSKYHEEFTRSNEQVRILKSLETRLKYINDAIAQKEFEEGLNVFLFGSGNIKDKEYEAFDYNEFGAIFDLFKAADQANRLLSTVELARVEHINHFKEIMELYVPILEVVKNTYLQQDGKLFENDDIRNKKIEKALELTDEYITNIKNFLDNNDVHYYSKRNIALAESVVSGQDLDGIFSRSEGKLYTELAAGFRYIGGGSNSKEAWYALFQKRLTNVKNDSEREFNKKVAKMMSALDKLGFNKLNPYQVANIVFQKKNGQRTHYLNTKYDVDAWFKSKKEYEQKIITSLQAFVLNSDDPSIKKVVVPDSYQDLMKIFEPIYHISEDVRKNLPEDLKAIWKIRDHYSELWGIWHALNSEDVDNIEDIKKQKRRDMSLYEYGVWEKENIDEYTTLAGDTVTYYKGELSRPADKYESDQYKKLSYEHKQIADYFFELSKELKQNLKLNNYNYEFYARAPQISKGAIDSIINPKSWKSSAKEGIKDMFMSREDDELFNRDNQGNIIKLPPVRFNNKVEDPNLLSTDITRMFTLYTGMVEHRDKFTKALPELQGMVDSVTYSEVDKGKTRISGKDSNLAKAMEELLDVMVYGNSELSKDVVINTIIGKISTTKTFNTLYKYVSNLSLAGNAASAITSLISSEVDKFVSAMVGDVIDMEDYKYGNSKFYKQGELFQVVADWERPIKKYKINSLAVTMALTGDIRSKMQNVSVNRGVKMIAGVAAPFSLWEATELPTVLPLIPAVGNRYRNVKGTWYSKEKFKSLTAEQKKDLDLKDSDWKTAPNLYDSITLKDNVLDFADAPQEIIDSFFSKTQFLANMMSQKMPEVDKGYAYRNFIARFFTMFLSWLYQTVAKAIKNKHYNWHTNQWEVGYYNPTSLRFYGGVVNQFMKDTLKSAMGFRVSYDTTKKILDYAANPHDSHNIRNFYRVALQMKVITGLSMIAFMLTGLALEDDDEDEKVDDTMIQILALLAVKVMIEQNSKLSIKDAYNFAQNPIGNFDRTFGVFMLFDSITGYAFSRTEDDEVKKGLYKGMDKGAKDIITKLPYVKGLFESYYGAYINRYLVEDSEMSIAQSYADKRQGLEFFVLNEKNQKAEARAKVILDLPIILSRIIGYYSGKKVLQTIGATYHHEVSDWNLRLPTKKAKEDFEKNQNQ